ncbi:glucuronate isomerase [Anaerolentibacter hominis]|uniref:glucuronate isomerase n=1 Tax=Anaerolentibacter hominis TaxID=3079009 RepID=UPI0031B894DE
MKEFMGKDFLLSNPTAVKLYEDYAKDMPIYDYHCHLSPKEIWENKQFASITEVWLGGDHYKWRQMRTMGIDEKYITGDASDYEKFLKWAETMPYLLGNPLYHWTHLELARFFGITKPLSPETADEIWEKTNAALATEEFRARGLIERSNVYAVCTTDDPADTLEYHQKIRQEGKMKTKVVPAMRPDKALQPENGAFGEYVTNLAATAQMEIDTYQDFKDALKKRIAFFNEMGCGACDHAFNYIPYEEGSESEAEAVFQKGRKGEALSVREQDLYKTNLMLFLAAEYKKYDWAMEIHVAALRNNNSRMFEKLGPDTGFDSINDYNYAPALSKLLDAMDKNGELPKTILFSLNPRDNYMIATMLGNFQGDGIPGKMQMGSAWWFLDHKYGMEEQMRTVMTDSMLSKFTGMVTDSRSFLSYPRHEYFRRILCNLIGELVENGEYPADMDTLGKIVQDICFHNAKNFIPVK